MGSLSAPGQRRQVGSSGCVWTDRAKTGCGRVLNTNAYRKMFTVESPSSPFLLGPNESLRADSFGGRKLSHQGLSWRFVERTPPEGVSREGRRKELEEDSGI